MEMPNPDVQTPAAPEPPTKVPKQVPKERVAASRHIPSIIVGVVIAAVAALSIWYLVRPQPLLVQGEVAIRAGGRAARLRAAGLLVAW